MCCCKMLRFFLLLIINATMDERSCEAGEEIGNERIRGTMKVVEITEKVQEGRLK